VVRCTLVTSPGHLSSESPTTWATGADLGSAHRERTTQKRGEVMTEHHTQSTHEARTSQVVNLGTVLRHYIADPTASWGLGTFGAVAEFHRTGDEPASLDMDTTLHVVTARG